MEFVYNLPENFYVFSSDFIDDNIKYKNFKENLKFILHEYLYIYPPSEYSDLNNINIFDDAGIENLCKSKNYQGDSYVNTNYRDQIKNQMANNIFIGEVDFVTKKLLSGCTLNFVYDYFEKNIIGIFIYTFCSSIGTKQKGEALINKIKLLLNELISSGYIINSDGVGFTGYDIIFDNNGIQKNLKDILPNFSFIVLNPTPTSINFYKNNEFNFYDKQNNLLYYVQKNDNISNYKKYLKYKHKYLKLKNKN
jgi:hypothetical protein